VLEQAFEEAKTKGGNVGVFPMQPIEGRPVSLTVPIQNFEIAPEPYDVALFRTRYRSPTFFLLQDRTVEVWQDVAAMGYPVANATKTADKYEVQQRVHKGYIQRVIPAGRLRPGSHPSCFELSFAVTTGLSGAPLFIHHADTEVLIGVCVGSHQSRVVQYESVSLVGEDERLREQLVRVEEFGIAHDLRPLLEWRPDCLGGVRLADLSAPT
jgi:hypothetical protein